jgi:hypothetical protein
MGALAAIVEAWPAAVGDAISRASWPQRIGRDGTLHVATTSAAWAFELGLLADDILSRLREAIPAAAPAALAFAAGPVPAPPAEVPAQTTAGPVVDAETRRLANELTAAMDDAELRETIARAAAASLARTASGGGF